MVNLERRSGGPPGYLAESIRTDQPRAATLV
jgi:hypothetical protein